MDLIYYLAVSFYQVYLSIFKPVTFDKYYKSLDQVDEFKLLIKLSFFSFVISLITCTIIGMLSTFLGYPVDWKAVLGGIVLGIAFGIAMGIAMGIGWGIAFGIAGGIVLGIARGIIAEDIAKGIAVSIAMSIAVGIVGGIGLGIGLGIAEGIAFGIAIGISFIFSYFRVFYIFPHIVQYLRVKVFKHEPFSIFRNSPIYWDEVILMPLPYLSDFLVILSEVNREKGLSEVEFVSSKRPTQRKAAFHALEEITVQDLSRFHTIREIADVSKSLSFLSSFESYLSKGFSDIVRNIENISIDANSYLNSTGNFNKLRTLNALSSDVDQFKRTLIATKGSAGYKFSSVAEKWSQIIEKENSKFIKLREDTFEEIPNPYIFGNPVRPDDTSRLFVGRIDILKEIESNLSIISQKPALFLHGRRRVGKSSVLINLPKFLGKQYIPVFIDCQDIRITESIASFCYTLSRSISNSLKGRGLNSEYPPFESFLKHPFITLGNWFDEVEKIFAKENKLILITFDEYEKIEESILSNKLTKDVLDQLRNIIQHRKYFVVLITGTGELNELKLNWSDYLISVKTIKLGHLSKAEARILITNPIDDFGLNYEGGENGEVVNKIINVTNCHPYLVQALCFELVNHLNIQQRNNARIDDIDASIEKVLISAEIYFYYIWNSECSENEKELLKKLAKNIQINENENEINSLIRKKILEKKNMGYKFKIELMKQWILKNN